MQTKTSRATFQCCLIKKNTRAASWYDSQQEWKCALQVTLNLIPFRISKPYLGQLGCCGMQRFICLGKRMTSMRWRNSIHTLMYACPLLGWICFEATWSRKWKENEFKRLPELSQSFSTGQLPRRRPHFPGLVWRKKAAKNQNLLKLSTQPKSVESCVKGSCIQLKKKQLSWSGTTPEILKIAYHTTFH